MPTQTPYRMAMTSAERKVISQAIDESNGNRLIAALALGLHPQTMERKVRMHGLNRIAENGSEGT